eukprot:TRINITY_DN1405_c0_g3_i1.p1 TRINITY_DN1405_c0_g3~~TRINITY_DN1405_c0_g3_i1.p1  ORF type:complete len:204 (-),score=55.01 TRINITY_DN1405_c0_g3_i1:6-617(-)
MCIRDRYQRRVHGDYQEDTISGKMVDKPAGITISMITSDSYTLSANFEAMKVCKPIEEFMKDNKSDVPIPLPKVRKPALEKIIKFCEMFQNKSIPQIEKPLKSNKLDAVLKDEWLIKFLEMPVKEMYELLMASDYLVLKGLEELVACAIAIKMVSKSTEDIRKEFEITNDLTPEEEKDIKEFFSWSEEVWPQRLPNSFIATLE